MSFLLRSLLALAVLISLSLPPAWAQDAASQSGDQQTSPAELQQASEALIRVLNDPKSREALIEMLQKTEGGAKQGGDSATAGTAQLPTTPSSPEASSDNQTDDKTAADEKAASKSSEKPADSSNGFVIKIGEYTRALADQFGMILDRALHSLSGLVLFLKGDISVKWDRAGDIVTQVAVVLAAAYVAYWVGQFVARLIYPKLSVRARYGGALARTIVLVLSSLIDSLTVLLGWGVGYFVALLAYDGIGAGVSLQESLALNAFFITGMANVALRFIFTPKRPELRLLPFDDTSAVYWNRRLALFSYWIGYGAFLAVPVTNIAISFVLGNAVRFLVVLIGMIYLLALVRFNRTGVREGTRKYAGTMQSTLAQKALTNFGNLWHLAAYGYIAAIFVIWVTRPFDATTIILRATGLSIVTIMGGMALSLVMTKAIKGGIRLPDDLHDKLPALQGRLNAFVPRLLKLIRLMVFLATLLLLLDIWGVVNVLDWAYSEAGMGIASRYGSAFVVIIVGFGIWLAVMSWVDLRLQSRAGYVVTARVRTLFQLFRNAFTVIIIVMVALLALSEIGIDIGPLIAGAGVVGLAISFGAQTLVKDIITGAFIQIENAINEGDVVTAAGITGVVEGITVRSLRVRDLDGTTHLIPFSSVDTVSNFMRGFSYHVALIGVAYDTDIPQAKEAMFEAFRRLQKTELNANIFEDLEMHGVVNFGASSIDIRARIKTTPGDQWTVGRAYNEYVKQVFDEQDIEIPFPQVTYHAATPPYDEQGDKPKKKRKRTGANPETESPSEDAPADE
ncbi:mechanosensitive ion channel [Rhodobacterales bacterium]|nr:mechanosensitive ion channel [Rhodobacterales bacterium]